MSISDKEHCFKCGRPYVYSEHDTKNGTWKIKCVMCGIDTRLCKSHKEAEEEWEKLKGQK